MRIYKFLVLALIFAATTARAAPASDDSINQLFEVTKVQKLLEGMQAQVGSMLDAAMQQSLNGKTPTPAQAEIIANMKIKFVNLIQRQLAWEKLQPQYLQLYRETFTEEEVDGMLAFYKTPAGQAVINKMPLLTQRIMVDTQKNISALGPQLQQIRNEFAKELAAGNTSSSGAGR